MSVLDETLLMFASVRTQLEGTKATLAATRSTLLKLGNCDDEIVRVNRMIRDADTVLARIAPKIKYVSNLKPTENNVTAIQIWNTLGRRSKLALAARDAREMRDVFDDPGTGERAVDRSVSDAVLTMADNYAKKVRK